MVAVVLGVLLAAVIGATLDPFNMQTDDDLLRAERAAYDIAYAEVQAAGHADGLPYGEVEHLAERIVQDGEGADTPYGVQFSDGWITGWNDALEALRVAAEAEGLPDNYTEFRILDEMVGR